MTELTVLELCAYPWALWTTARASWLYVNGKISAGEWHTRIGVARVAVGTDEVNVDEAGAEDQ